MHQKRSKALRTWFVTAIGVASTSLFSCRYLAPRPVSITVGVPPLEQNALLYVAAERNLFGTNGLTVTLKDFDSGPSAIAALMHGTVDIAETAEFPFVEAVMDGQELRIIAANDRFENDYLVARRDRRIRRISDLKGKRIGLATGTITDFYLGRFLTLNGIASNEVTKVNVRPRELVQSILSGRVDAIVAWEPYVSRITMESPAVFDVWPVQSRQAVFGLLACRATWLQDHEGSVTMFLRSLAGAEDFLERNPAVAKAIVAKVLD